MRYHSFFSDNYQSKNQYIGNFKDVKLYLKREDLIHPIVSGNKFRKLKYSLLEAKKNAASVLTFGGAFSNHIAATAEACKILGLKSIGLIRGEELGEKLDQTLANNPTLRYAHNKGMQLHFVSRTDYRLKEKLPLINTLKEKYPALVCLPEGGTNELAIKGCKEILNSTDDFDIICTSAGTGGTLAGLIEASTPSQHCIGFSALKGNFLEKDIRRWTSKPNWSLETQYHFGGYAKVNSELIEFINTFHATHKIPLDPIYTGKMLYGIFDKIQAGHFPKNTRILAIHTGGLQGIEGMNALLKQKGLSTIS